MKKEYTLVFIAGLFILAYVLDAVVNPLTVDLATPYHYLDPQYLAQFPFTTASIVIKALGLFLAPLWLLSFMNGKHMARGAILLVLAGLMQLYALQEVTTGAALVPLEWSLSLSVAGVALLLPAILNLIRGGISSMAQSITGEGFDEQGYDDEGLEPRPSVGGGKRKGKGKDKDEESVLLP